MQVHYQAMQAVLLHERADELAHIMTSEMGKRIGKARGEVEFSSNILAYYAKNAEPKSRQPMQHAESPTSFRQSTGGEVEHHA
jgi:acyl-CoA reductase-like NAD-dependent aldehyde dehydrogenase